MNILEIKNIVKFSKTLKVLYVEDNPADVFLAKEFLLAESPNINFHCATTLTDAYAEVVVNNIDVMLVDLNLPDSDGINTVNSLNKLSKELPIVVLTNSEEKNTLNRIKKAQMFCFLKKQVFDTSTKNSFKTLASTINYLGNQRLKINLSIQAGPER